MKEKYVQTERLNTYVRYSDESTGKPKLMLIHGNVSSSAFFTQLFPLLENTYEIVAPDLRCYGHSEQKPVDSTRGMRDFSDDIDALARALDWKKFTILGWSLGGGVAMQYTIDYPETVEALVLEAPLSPFGFGGTYDEDGKKLEPLGIGTGAANQGLVNALKTKDRGPVEQTISSTYVAPGFTLDKDLMDLLVNEIFLMKLGDDAYPGKIELCQEWPGFKSGKTGIGSTMSPAYCDLSPLGNLGSYGFPILWIRGDKDVVVSDTSVADMPYLGKLNLVPGWPGEEKFPVQPMLKQTRYVLENYKKSGGSYTETVISGTAHGVHLQKPEEFAKLIINLQS